MKKKIHAKAKNKNMEGLEMVKYDNKTNELKVDIRFVEPFVKDLPDKTTVQNRLIGILTLLWKKSGLDTSFLDDKDFIKLINHLVSDAEFFSELYKDVMSGDVSEMDIYATSFEYIMSLSQQGVEEFNARASYKDKQKAFFQCLAILGLYNLYNRLGLMCILVPGAYLIKSAEGKHRLFLLRKMLCEQTI